MRTTLDIESPVLEAARESAKLSGCTLGEVISAWARQGMSRPVSGEGKTILRNGVTVYQVPLGTPPVTTEMVKQLLAHEDAPAGH